MRLRERGEELKRSRGDELEWDEAIIRFLADKVKMGLFALFSSPNTITALGENLYDSLLSIFCSHGTIPMLTFASACCT